MLFAARTCPFCQREWLEAAPVDLTPGDVVRAYDGNETAVDWVASIDGDNVEVAGRRMQRWQVISY